MEQISGNERKDPRKQGFEEIFNMYKNKVFRLAYRFVMNQADAEDITQDVFITIYHKLDSFRGESSLFSWMYRITANKCIRHLKKRAIQAGKNSAYGEKTEKNVKEDIRYAISKAIDSLSEKYKRIVIMHDIEGFSHKEISRILKCPEGTIWSSLYYARKQLREELKNII